MAKCGKGCMPECEYFTTGGCISLFNCPYKIETEYINSATSTPDSLTDLLIEFDEMGFAPATVCEDPEAYAKKWKDQVWEAVRALKAENAALRKQVSEMIMPPCTLGDTLYITSFCFGDGYDEAGNAVHKSGWQITETKVDEKNFFRMCDLLRNDKAFFSKEAAEIRLAELKGENE